ncbi:MAG TPA: oligopeptide/dipeptide ABC transporter ATP-binding protein [Trebonia sp.]|jgi:peptide/nickel transport system ATP-binding protein|nr:oligopeptide/dipeptide ABC transporter ATP-binding protein [Trebonia sp.]
MKGQVSSPVSEPAGAPPASAGPPAPVAQVSDLHVTFHRDGRAVPVLRGVDLAITPGEILGLVGESGSGKSVMALSLLGLLPASARPQTSGQALVTGVDMLSTRQAALRTVRRQSLGVIFQDPMTSLNPTMRVGRQITEVGGDEEDAVGLLSAVHVPQPRARMRAFPHELSGGLRQRVMAAMALTGRPALVIADEPTTALDVTVQAQLLRLLAELRDEFGCGVLFITHDLGVAAQITDRIAVLYRGRLAEIGPTAQVLAFPRHAYTAGLLASRLSLDTPRGSAIPTLAADEHDPADLSQGCAYRSRCAIAVGRCATQTPPLMPAGVPVALSARGALATPSAPAGSAPQAAHRHACWVPGGALTTVLAPADAQATADPTATPAGHAKPPAGPADPLAAFGETPAATPATATPAMNALPVVEVADVEQTFTSRHGWGRRHQVHALRGVDLRLEAGESLSVVGESGSGKSTLLRAIAGLTRPSAGTVTVRGTTQMVFQDAGSSLTPWLTVEWLLRERLRPLELDRAGQAARVAATLEAMGLPGEVAGRRPAELSGGQRQRVALARATIVAPAVLLCDEPTSALDASLAATVLNLIREMRGRLGMAVLFVTHDLAVARLMGDRIAVMAEGRIVESGVTQQVVTSPQTEFTRSLLAAVPRIDLQEATRS